MDWKTREKLFEKFSHLAVHPLASQVFLPGESEDHGLALMSMAAQARSSLSPWPLHNLGSHYGCEELKKHLIYI